MIIFSLGFTFSLASVPGEETGIDSLSVPGAGAVGSVRSLRYPAGLREFVFD